MNTTHNYEKTDEYLLEVEFSIIYSHLISL